MLADFFSFLLLLAVPYLAYGISVESLLSAGRPSDKITFIQIFQRPYFHIFGDMQLEDINALAGCTSETYFYSCANNSGIIVGVLQALFHFFVNLLCINLLIAMLNKSYQDVTDVSFETWTKLNYELLQEYYIIRPILPGGLVLISHLISLYRMIKFLICNPDQASREDRRMLSTEDKKDMEIQEKQTKMYFDELKLDKQKKAQDSVSGEKVCIAPFQAALSFLSSKHYKLKFCFPVFFRIHAAPQILEKCGSLQVEFENLRAETLSFWVINPLNCSYFCFVLAAILFILHQSFLYSASNLILAE
jgi:hypothetical protein